MEPRCGSGTAGLVGADEGPMRGDSNLDNPALIGNKVLAHSLVGWAADLGLRLEVFSLGPAAALIGANPTTSPLRPCSGSPWPALSISFRLFRIAN
jgi:hypothetical protein